ncbi:helix-turn-helix domain-containing protein [Pigmentiphaga sp. D-2]|uniref:helix-turn-helix domain-containing protein n=1 Tax=Pigmentiphaga sp. D-2 TaxID=1002116 RepID=UPI001FB5C4BC|nr:helix-turn-helix transcriptional regulator [Pigmentiphaga sp. D-2]
MTSKEQLINQKLGKTIAHKRKVAGFTQEEVADRLGIGSEAFSRIERGLVSPGIPKLYELAELFECGVETFLVEGSRRPTDQAEYLARLIEHLSATDRSLIVSIAEKLARRLSKDAKAKTDEHQFLI